MIRAAHMIRAYFALAHSAGHYRGQPILLEARIRWPWGETGALLFP